MDISQVNDIKELKALAYDTVQLIERQQTNLRLLQQRIAELEQTPAQEPQQQLPIPDVEKKK